MVYQIFSISCPRHFSLVDFEKQQHLIITQRRRQQQQKKTVKTYLAFSVLYVRNLRLCMTWLCLVTLRAARLPCCGRTYLDPIFVISIGKVTFQ